MPGARVHQAADRLLLEHVVQARLVAGDAGVDPVGLTGLGLAHEVGVGQQRPRHAHDVRAAVGEDLLGELGRVDPVAGDERDVQPSPRSSSRIFWVTQVNAARGTEVAIVGIRASCQPMPVLRIVAPAAVTALASRDHLGPGLALGDQVQHRQPVDDDEVLADRLPRASHDLDGQTHAVVVAAAPLVGALVGVGHQELVDEVALGAHDLDAVVAGLTRELGAADERADLRLDAAATELVRRERRDRALDPRRRDRQRVVGVATGVQDLHRDRAALVMDGLRQRTVLPRVPGGDHAAAERLGPALDARGETACDDQAHAAARPLGEVGGQGRKVLPGVLEAGVHRAHEDAVSQRGEPQVERFQQVRIGSRGHAPSVTAIVRPVGRGWRLPLPWLSSQRSSDGGPR